jgi:hypothetical protein
LTSSRIRPLSFPNSLLLAHGNSRLCVFFCLHTSHGLDR